jgi:hypothetical protein
MQLTDPLLDKGRPKGKARLKKLLTFADTIIEINNSMPNTIHWKRIIRTDLDTLFDKWDHERFDDTINWRILDNTEGDKWSSRGWCYLLEGHGISKGDFDKAQKLINDCRKLGFLPIDFVAQDEKRDFANIEHPNEDLPIDYFKRLLKYVLDSGAETYNPDWWEGEEYYVEMLVEKIDLKTIFEPVCKRYHIPIANSGGWYDILERAQMAERFKWAEDRGLKPVLLYCGDLDPWGREISKKLMENFRTLRGGTRWKPDALEKRIYRFGLEPEFIDANNLTWIENLESGSGHDMTKKPNRIITDYIAEMEARYGVGKGIRKCEANAVVTAYDAAIALCTLAIEKWLGSDALRRFEAKRNSVRNQIEGFKERSGIDGFATSMFKSE